MRHPAKAKVKKDPRKKAVKAADKAFAEYIRERDGKCLCCGSRENLQCGHLYSRVAYSTRWDEQNGFCQCRGCNIMHEHDFEPLRRVALKIHGEKALERLYGFYNRPAKFRTDQIEEIARYYSNKTEVLRERRAASA